MITYYFSPILSGHLVVHVSDESEDTRVDYDSIYNIATQMDWGHSGSSLSPQDRGRMFDLVQNLETTPDQDRIIVTEPEPCRNPGGSPIIDRIQPAELEDARSRFEGGEAVTSGSAYGFIGKGKTRTYRGSTLWCNVTSRLAAFTLNMSGNDLTIPSAGPSRLGVSSNFRSLLVVNEGHLAGLPPRL